MGRAVERFGARVQSSALARRSLVAALVVAVAAPVHSGGVVAGSLAGRLLGLGTTQTFAAVMGAISFRTVAVVLAAYGVTAA